MSQSPSSQSPAEWLRYARADLLLAEIEPPTGVFLELLCFHAQQSAEKAFKSVLLALTTASPPRTHDLVLLLDLLRHAGAPEPLPLDPVAAQRLSVYAVLTRYPADLGEIDRAEWQQAVTDARAVMLWAERVIAPQPPP